MNYYSINRKAIPLWGWILITTLLCPRLQAHPYREDVPGGCEQAFRFYELHIDDFAGAAIHCGVSGEFLFALVAPELSRYSEIQDAAETFALKTLYVRLGTSYANFSIGPFQMKPSFAEYMEAQLLKDPYLQYIPYFAELLPKGGTKRDQRVERVKRLESWEMQLRYLTLFTILTERKYKNHHTTKAKLMWFASVYNTGLQHTQEKIQKMSTQALFPGSLFKKYHYNELSYWFYTQVYTFK